MGTDNGAPFHPHPPAHRHGAYQVVHYERAAIHEGVPITPLVATLNRAGLTLSNVDGRGLVIHVIGQNPQHPAPPACTDPTPKEPS